jgi:hypothetical protein
VVQNFTDSARSSDAARAPNSFYCSANSGISATARIPAKGATKWQTKLLAASADEALARQAKLENTREIARENPDRFISPIAIHSIHNRAVLRARPFFPRNNLRSYPADRLLAAASC